MKTHPNLKILAKFSIIIALIVGTVLVIESTDDKRLGDLDSWANYKITTTYGKNKKSYWGKEIDISTPNITKLITNKDTIIFTGQCVIEKIKH